VIRKLDLSNEPELLELLELQRASYAVEAALIDSQNIPPLKDTPATLSGCGETFLGCFLGGKLVGAVSYKTTDGVVDIHRLVVHPDHFRRGIARSLLGRLEEVEHERTRILVSTGSKNIPARNLYRSLGFGETGEAEPAPELFVTHFEKAVRPKGRRRT
jgi:ribosomal protein S18 acetylase RimI-like enzyme